jgi:hypothetical protein
MNETNRWQQKRRGNRKKNKYIYIYIGAEEQKIRLSTAKIWSREFYDYTNKRTHVCIGVTLKPKLQTALLLQFAKDFWWDCLPISLSLSHSLHFSCLSACLSHTHIGEGEGERERQLLRWGHGPILGSFSMGAWSNFFSFFFFLERIKVSNFFFLNGELSFLNLFW